MRVRTSILAGLAAAALAGCSSPSPERLAAAIRSGGDGLVKDAVVRRDDTADDYVEVTFRAGVSDDQAHGVWCRAVVPNGGRSPYDDPSAGIYVDTLASTGERIVFPIDCP